MIPSPKLLRLQAKDKLCLTAQIFTGLSSKAAQHFGGERSMKRFHWTSILAIALLAVAILAPIGVAHVNITYFTIAGTDKDGGRLCCSTSSNYVQSALGANGLPVLNPGGENGGAVPLQELFRFHSSMIPFMRPMGRDLTIRPNFKQQFCRAPCTRPRRSRSALRFLQTTWLSFISME
jgi:hypothetical protein